jgi:hypothetical protein
MAKPTNRELLKEFVIALHGIKKKEGIHFTLASLNVISMLLLSFRELETLLDEISDFENDLEAQKTLIKK